MKKLFISQPMRDKTNQEILSVREEAIKTVERELGEPIEVIESFFQDAPLILSLLLRILPIFLTERRIYTRSIRPKRVLHTACFFLPGSISDRMEEFSA